MRIVTSSTYHSLFCCIGYNNFFWKWLLQSGDGIGKSLVIILCNFTMDHGSLHAMSDCTTSSVTVYLSSDNCSIYHDVHQEYWCSYVVQNLDFRVRESASTWFVHT